MRHECLRRLGLCTKVEFTLKMDFVVSELGDKQTTVLADMWWQNKFASILWQNVNILFKCVLKHFQYMFCFLKF